MKTTALLLAGSSVSHSIFGGGVVEFSKGEMTLVRFGNRIEEFGFRPETYPLRDAEAAKPKPEGCPLSLE